MFQRNFLWAYEDFYRRPTPPTRDQHYFSQNYQRRGRYNEDQFGNAPAATSGYERLSNANPTARNYVDSTPSNENYYYNASETHGQGVINKRKSEGKSMRESLWSSSISANVIFHFLGFEQDSKMVYPSEEETSSTDNQIKSSNCSFGLCDEVDDYPVEKVHNILKRYELKNYFSIEKEVNIINRFGEDTENLCATITHTRFPKTAKNMQDKEQVIVNVDQYKQGVVFETCKK